MPILRLYNTADDAMEAVNELKQFKYGRVGIQLFGKGADDISVDALTAMGLADAKAQRFVQAVGDGGAVLAVEPPFGIGVAVMEVLEKSRPGDTGPSQAIETRPPSDGELRFGSQDPAAPFSAAMGWRTLLNDPAPLSRWLNMPTLLTKRAPKASTFGVPLLSSEAAPLSAKLGLPVLSADPAPLSSKLGLPVLLDDPAPLSSRLGLPVLSKDRAER